MDKLQTFAEWLTLREGPYGISSGGDDPALQTLQNHRLGLTDMFLTGLLSGTPDRVGPALNQIFKLNDDRRQEVLNALRQQAPAMYEKVMNYLLQRHGAQPPSTAIPMGRPGAGLPKGRMG